VIENHAGLLWFWGLWECSQLFVQSKLKTPLGKPQDSFLAIESALKAYFNNTSTNNDSQSTQSASGESTIKNQKSNSDDWYMDLSRVTLLVQFVEYLEKNIYNGIVDVHMHCNNAYEGTAASMTQPSLKAIKIFFRTNKSTCIDWFSRNYSLFLFFPSSLNQE
jgi:PI-3-kinase-related kinase SMG-1